ncbi:hypothetical protein EON65_16720, partial [archaeon]
MPPTNPPEDRAFVPKSMQSMQSMERMPRPKLAFSEEPDISRTSYGVPRNSNNNSNRSSRDASYNEPYNASTQRSRPPSQDWVKCGGVGGG